MYLLSEKVIMKAAESLLMNFVLNELESSEGKASLQPQFFNNKDLFVAFVLKEKYATILATLRFLEGAISAAWNKIGPGHDMMRETVEDVFTSMTLDDAQSADAFYAMIMACAGEGTSITDNFPEFKKKKLDESPLYLGSELFIDLFTEYLDYSDDPEDEESPSVSKKVDTEETPFWNSAADYSVGWGCDPSYDLPPRKRGDGELFYQFANKASDKKYLHKLMDAICRTAKSVEINENYGEEDRAKQLEELRIFKWHVAMRIKLKLHN